MGVKGLQNYIEHHCPEAFKDIFIEEFAHQHRMQHNCDAVLVVDGSALIYPLYSSGLEWIYGGQWIQFIAKLENFIHKFRMIGVKLVFFFDGTVSSSKRKEWVRRRVSKYREIASIFDQIKANYQHPDNKFFQLPTSMGTLTRFALKELGAEVYQTDREADEVIANYAASNKNVFGILSQDSDFIIYNTKSYLSLSHLNLDTMQTKWYNRNYLASHYLKLHVQQLPLFACLAGNDIVSFTKLKQFHQSLSPAKGSRIMLGNIVQNLVTFIKMQNWTGNYRNEIELNNISLSVFGSSHWAKLIHDGLKSYSLLEPHLPPEVCISVHDDLAQSVYERHIHCINGPFIFNLLCNLEYESSETLEDPSWIPSALKFRKIRQRCYGILFDCVFQTPNGFNLKKTRNGMDIKVKEWCAFEGNLMETPEKIDPLPMENHRPTELQYLWFNSTDREKMWYFWSIFQAPLNFELLFTLPKNLIVLTCILNYLISTQSQNPDIQAWEVAVFIAQALWNLSYEDLWKLQPQYVDASAVHLATLFMRGVTTALMVLGTCGYPFDVKYAMPWQFFDGKRFHYLYVKTKQTPMISTLFERQENYIKEFYTVLQAVTNNTIYDVKIFNWKRVLSDF